MRSSLSVSCAEKIVNVCDPRSTRVSPTVMNG